MLKLLFVDDDPEEIGLIKEIFEGEGYIVFVAYNRNDAIKVAKEHPEIVVSTIDGLDGDGVLLVKEMIAQGLGGKLIACSCHQTINDHLCEAGCVTSVHKLEGIDELINRVKNIVSEPS